MTEQAIEAGARRDGDGTAPHTDRSTEARGALRGLLGRFGARRAGGGDGGRPARPWYRPRVSTLVALLIVMLAVWARIADPPPVQYLRLRAFDFYQQLYPRQQDPAASPVVIVDVDEESLADIGQWPWARTKLALLVANLANAGAVVIGFDMVFAEPDRLSPENVADSLDQLTEEERARLREYMSNDAVFADVLKQTGRAVMGRSGYAREVVQRSEVPRSTGIGYRGPSPLRFMDSFPTVIANVPTLEENAAGNGLFSLSNEFDGIVRRVPLVARVGERVFPALSLEMLRVVQGQKSYLINTNEAGIASVAVQGGPGQAGFLIPTDGAGRVYVHFAPHMRERYLSAKDVLTGDFEPSRVAQRLVLVGTSAVGMLDIRSTPLDPIIPGVEVHANLLENVIFNRTLSRPNYANSVESLIILIGGLLMVVLVPRLGAVRTLILLGVSLGGFAALSWYLFVEHRTLIDVSFPALVVSSVYAILVFANYVRDEAEKRQVRGAFSRYMSPALVERLADHPEQLKLGGEMRDMTLLFSDIRGFTTISESFGKDPEGLTNFINQFLTPMTDIILSHGGTIDKYMGDAIMAFWNAPLRDAEHARNACRAALAMIGRIGNWNREMRAAAEAAGRPHYDIAVGVGLNTGQCCVGNMGSNQRFDYSVLGDTVNLASRLEGQSKTYGVDIVIGDQTRAAVPELACLQLDHIRVKGKLEPVMIYCLIGDETLARSEAFAHLRDRHDAMIEAYRARRFDDARRLLADCRASMDGVGDLSAFYTLYDERLDAFAETPPPADWDGVFVARTK